MEKRPAVISYPRLAQKDWDWIQRIRVEQDMFYRLIKPHITFVFPSRTQKTAFTGHVRRMTLDAKGFVFEMRCALIAPGRGQGNISHVMLVPDKGFSDIVKLHDRLYTAILAAELRLDVPFFPHIGIGNSTDMAACKRLADYLNEQDFVIEGTVDTLDIVEIIALERISTEVPEAAEKITAVNTVEQIQLSTGTVVPSLF